MSSKIIPALAILFASVVVTYGQFEHVESIVNSQIQTLLDQGLRSVVLPDLHGTAGMFDWTITNTKIQKVRLPRPDVRFQPEIGKYTWSVTDGSMELAADWIFDGMGISDRRTSKVHVDGYSLAITITIDFRNPLSPEVFMSTCNAHIERITVSLSGGFSWPLNVAANAAIGSLKDPLVKLSCAILLKGSNETPALVVSLAEKLAPKPPQIPHIQLPNIRIPHIQLPNIQIPHVQVPNIQIPNIWGK